MRVVIDIEANNLKPELVTSIWVIVCRDVDTNEVHIFREVTQDAQSREAFLSFARNVTCWIGHNWLGYDYLVLLRLLRLEIPDVHLRSFDTLTASKLMAYSREGGHSIESWGQEFGLPKIEFSDFSRYSKEMEVYCVRDVEISHLIWLRYGPRLRIDNDSDPLVLEQCFQLICNDLHSTGFAFDTQRAEQLLRRVEGELEILDKEIDAAFPPRDVLIRKFVPKETKYGTINKSSVPRALHHRIHEFVVGESYDYTKPVPFNASSHKQLIDVLTEAGWRPVKKTATHIEAEREFKRNKTVDLKTKLEVLLKYGWQINEDNLATLPETAPAPARSLARRILLESRRRTLTEWIALVQPDGRIHGKFYGIGAWTHRMAHQEPNTANIPREFKEDGSVKLLGKELRQLWIAPKKKLLVGVDAEGIQLRIFAHLIDDEEFTHALVEGRKDNKSDPHSLNQRILGNCCKTRQAAKRFIYALLLGAGINKLCEILGASREDTEEALNRLLLRYTGWKRLREKVFPQDAKRGYFIGLDGRQVSLPGETQRDREHLAMSGYLQCGEAVCIKRAAVIAKRIFQSDPVYQSWAFVDIVHDELQSEIRNNLKIALQVAKIKADAIKAAGEYYKLKCPLAGSFYNEDIKDYTIGTDWFQTH